MEFKQLLAVAQAKSSEKTSSSEGSKYYSTKFEPPKKDTPNQRKLSANIQKFLAQREQEEAKKKREEKQKLDDLMAMRDTKSKNKIRKMLKVTKSANKSVLDDATDADNTAITLQGNDQPDEDDYGYVSHEAGQLYSQIMDKYKIEPEKEKAKEQRYSQSRPQSKHDLNGTMDRVRAAINREREEENAPRKRSSASASTSTTSASPSTSSSSSSARQHSSHSSAQQATSGSMRKPRPNAYDPVAEKRAAEQRQREERQAKHRNRAPPPPDFNTLIEIARQRHVEPVAAVDFSPASLVAKAKAKAAEPERLMSSRERKEADERQHSDEERERRRAAREGGARPMPPPGPSSGQPPLAKIGRIPKVGSAGAATESIGRIPKLNGGSSKPNGASHSSASKSSSSSSTSSSHRPSSSSTSNTSKPSASSNSNTSRQPAASTSHSSSQRVAHKPIASSNGSSSSAPSHRPAPSNSTAKSATSSSSTQNRKPGSSTSSASAKLARPAATSSASIRPATLNGRPSVTASASAASAASTKTRPFPPTTTADLAKTRQFPPADLKNRKPAAAAPTDQKTRKFPPADVKTRQFPPADVRTRQFPPADVRSRQFPPPDVRGQKRPGAGANRSQPNGGNAAKRPRVIEDSDSEYDSEMDDFIDDEDEEEDYSKHIKEIFGYDKSRYRHLDEDDANMESSYAQQQKEEFISKKIGRMEDLEDMRMEAEEMKAKAKKRGGRRLADSDED